MHQKLWYCGGSVIQILWKVDQSTSGVRNLHGHICLHHPDKIPNFSEMESNDSQLCIQTDNMGFFVTEEKINLSYLAATKAAYASALAEAGRSITWVEGTLSKPQRNISPCHSENLQLSSL